MRPTRCGPGALIGEEADNTVRLTMRADYGAHAIIELAKRYGEGPVQCADIAARQKIPEAYLDQLLAALRRTGIIRSIRGPHGGHELARHPGDLSLGEVVTALEGPVVPQEFVHVPTDDDQDDANWQARCAVRNAWHAAAEASQRVLDATTIQALVDEQTVIRTRRLEGAPTTTDETISQAPDRHAATDPTAPGAALSELLQPSRSRGVTR